jgi:hypothetical protein
MSENPTPTPTSTATAPSTVKVTGIERTGTGLTILGVIAGAIPLLFLAFANNVTISTSDQVRSVATTGLILTIAAVVLGLVATGLNLPNLGKRLGPGLSTFFSGATLITLGLFLLVTVLPRVSAIQTLNDKTEPFAKAINANCGPLSTVSSDYQKAQLDANGVAGAIANGQVPAAADLAAFAQAMTADAAIFQKDANSFNTYQANLNKLTSPDSKYDKLLADCKKDVASTIAFLSGNGIPTTEFVTGLNASIDGLKQPATVTAAIKAAVDGAVPASYNAQTLLQDAAKAATGQLPFTLPAGIPDAQKPALTLAVVGVLGGGYPVFVSQAMGQASTSTDTTLTNEGNQLRQDIKDTLTNNLAPFTVDTTSIVDEQK